jgi:hypothetical protein
MSGGKSGKRWCCHAIFGQGAGLRGKKGPKPQLTKRIGLGRSSSRFNFRLQRILQLANQLIFLWVH